MGTSLCTTSATWTAGGGGGGGGGGLRQATLASSQTSEAIRTFIAIGPIHSDLVIRAHSCSVPSRNGCSVLSLVMGGRHACRMVAQLCDHSTARKCVPAGRKR